MVGRSEQTEGIVNKFLHVHRTTAHVHIKEVLPVTMCKIRALEHKTCTSLVRPRKCCVLADMSFTGCDAEVNDLALVALDSVVITQAKLDNVDQTPLLQRR